MNDNTQMEEERRKKADANAAEAAETARLAANARMNEDSRPLENILADRIKNKLENEEFQKPEQA